MNDFAEIMGHIAEHDFEAAAGFGNSLLDHLNLLGRCPHLAGTIRGRSRMRKLVHSPYWFAIRPPMEGVSSKFSTSAMDRASHRGSERYLPFRRAASSCAMMTP